MIRLIPVGEFATSIPKYFDLLDEAASATGGRFDVDDVIWGLLQGQTQLWAWDDPPAIAVTEINQYPQAKTVNIFAVAGRDHRSWLRESLREIEKWAIQMGATRVELSCRTGWERLLKPLDYRRTYVLLEKPLGDEEQTTNHDADDRALEARDPVSYDRPRTG